jgi:hypothetical protein
VPAFTVWVFDPIVTLPACVAVGAVHAFTVPQASSGASWSAAGADAVGIGVGAAAGGSAPHAPTKTARDTSARRTSPASNTWLAASSKQTSSEWTSGESLLLRGRRR